MVSTTRLYQIDQRLKQAKPENDGLICKYPYSKKDQAKACKDAPDSAMRAHLSKAFFYFCKASPELSMSHSYMNHYAQTLRGNNLSLCSIPKYAVLEMKQIIPKIHVIR